MLVIATLVPRRRVGYMALNEELSGEGQNAAHFQSRVPARISRPGSRSTKAAVTTLQIARGEFNVRGSTQTRRRGVFEGMRTACTLVLLLSPHLYYRPRGAPSSIFTALTELIATEPFPVPQGLPSYFRRPADVRHI